MSVDMFLTLIKVECRLDREIIAETDEIEDLQKDAREKYRERLRDNKNNQDNELE
ncbi:MAG: hypothetical protein AB8C40_04795 [Gammaproteobacteria bacterium]